MNQEERRRFLIGRLLAEQPRYAGTPVPSDADGQKRLLRTLMNLRPPAPIDSDFLTVQDEYLRAETAAKGVTELASLSPAAPGLYLWQGDITTLRCDAIVNAANSGMTGCYVPCHGCIDNCIHTYAGVQLRLACARHIAAQGHEAQTGSAALTPAYNLPCRYVLHTVGPIITGPLTARDEALLARCYTACLALADQHGLTSIAFCCISTGEFHFPNGRAAQIAVQTVQAYQARTNSSIKVIFNVFKDTDADIYRRILASGAAPETGD